MFTDYRHTQDTILARHGQHLDQSVSLAVGDGAIQIIDAEGRHLVVDTLLPGLGFVEADTRHFGIGEGRPGDHRVIRLEAFEQPEQ